MNTEIITECPANADTPLPKEAIMVQSIVCAQTTVQEPDGVVLGLAKSIVIIVCVQKLSVI